MKRWLDNIDNVYTLPKITQRVYNKLISDADSNCACNGYKVWGKPTSNENLKEIMCETYNFFSTHYFKQRRALVNIESALQKNSCYQKCINIIDIGCNIGTATYSYIDLLVDMINNTKSTDLYEINIIFIECSKIRCDLLRSSIDRYRDKLKLYKPNISIEYSICNDRFPENIDIVEKLIRKDSPCLMLMSNVIYWMGNEEEIAEGINNINMSLDYYKNLKIIHVENKKMNYKIKKVYEVLNLYGIYDMYGPKFDEKLEYFNPQNTYFYNSGTKSYKHKGFYFGKVEPTDSITALVNDDLLKSAFEKTEFYHQMDFMSDFIEMKYARDNYIKIKEYLKKKIKQGYIYSNNYMEYTIPKNETKNRALFVDHFINEFFSVALNLVIGTKIDYQQDNNISYGNRLLSKRESPYVMKNYFQQFFHQYLMKAKELVGSGLYEEFVKIDIKSFYNNIEHFKLLEIIDEFIDDNEFWFKKSSWFKKTIESFINREILMCKKDCGLPQGPTLSAVLANMYLSKLDNWISKKLSSTFTIRYVDDIIVFSQQDSEKIRRKISMYLDKKLSLTVNSKKTDNGNIGDLEIIDIDDSYSDISETVFTILISIYSLDKRNYKKFMKAPYDFCRRLSLCLKAINVYIPEEWLVKKLFDRSKDSYFTKKLQIKSKKIYKINWGKIPRNRIDAKSWKKQFLRKNKSLIKELNNLFDRLSNEFSEIYDEYIKLKYEDNIEIRRKLKYLFNKLGIFTNESLFNDDMIREFLDKPWVINTRKIAAYPKFKHLLIAQLNNYQFKENEFKTIISTWLLGEMRSKKSHKVIKKIFINTLSEIDKQQILLNSLACESLLKLNIWENFSTKDLADKIDKAILGKDNIQYQLIRNAYIILSIVDKKIIKKYIIKGISKFKDDEYTVIFLRWLNNNLGKNIIYNYNKIDEDIRRQYPTTEYTNQDYVSV